MKKIIILLSIAAIGLFQGCDIERLPYGYMPSETIKADPDASLGSLLNGVYGQLQDWSDVMHRCGEYAGDNVMIRGTSTDSFYEFISYSRTPNNGRLNTFWNNSYKIIAQTSNIINMIKEGESVGVDNKLGECYYMRGMMYFYLCRAYGRPYFQSPETNLGVPIVNGTPDDVLNALLPDRATVKATYEQAISDLKKGAKLMSTNTSNIAATRITAYAMLSRIYLYMSGTYDNANKTYAQLSVNYADSVILSGKHELLSRSVFMKYNTLTPELNSETIFAVKRLASEFSGDDHYYGVGGMYSNIGDMGWGEMYASAKYIDLLNETGRNDWAKGKLVDARAAFIEPQYEEVVNKVFRFVKNVYKNGIQTNYNYVQASIVDVNANPLVCKEGTVEFPLTAIDAEQGIYSVAYSDGKTYTGVIDNRMKINRVYPMFYIVKCSREGEESQLHSPVIINLAEVYLNKAEAAAKMGNYPLALAALNIIRERSLPGEGYLALDVTNAEKCIDKERQLELAFRAERSYDVYRNGRSLTRAYPGPHKAMEEVLATDYRVTYYIPQTAINSYPGPLTQNPTAN